MPNGPLPPLPKHSALTAYAIVLPVLAVALLTFPIWMSAFGVLKLMQRITAWAAQKMRGRSRTLSPAATCPSQATVARQ